MTNKPMLSVERELIQRIADHCKFWIDHPYLEAIADVEVKLRALLDKPEYPRINIVKAHTHTCACVVGDSGVCDCGAVVDGVAVEVKPDAQHQGEAFTYSSKQATNCAGCGIRKHTPLRVDDMGGYVCLTCIDNRLGELLAAEQHQGEPVAELQVAFFENGPMATINWFTPSAFETGATKLYAEQPAPVSVDAPSRDELIKMLRHFASCANAGQVGTAAMDFVARLNGVKPIEQAKTCCGSCPGGCVAGLNGVKP